MKKTFLKSAVLAVAGIGLMAGSAAATLIDFTDSSIYGAIDTETSNTFTHNYSPELGVTLLGQTWDGSDWVDSNVDLTFNGNEGPGAINIGTAVFLGDGDGIGINDDEISYQENLTVQFNPMVSSVNEVYFLDLFNTATEMEYAWIAYSFEDSIWTAWGVDGIGTRLSEWGGVSVGYSQLDNVLAIAFTGDNCCSDFSLAGIDVSEAAPVPEPATMLLFGTGLAGLAGIRRRKAKKNS